MPTPAAEPMPGPVFVIADTAYRLVVALLGASVLAFLITVVAGVLAEEVHPDLAQIRPAYLLVRELLGVTIIGALAGAVLIGPARTARQVALGSMLIKAGREPAAALVAPDPRGPVGRSPFLPATAGAVASMIGAVATLAVLADQPGAATGRLIVIIVLAAAVIAVPLLVLLGRRWQTHSLPLLDGQLSVPTAEPGAGSPGLSVEAQRPTVRWLPWLYAAGLVIFFGALFVRRPDEERLRYGETADRVIELALLIGGGLITAAVLLTVIRLLLRSINESVRLRQSAAGSFDLGRLGAQQDLTGVAPAGRGSLVIICATVWLTESLLGLARLRGTGDPVLAGWLVRLPDLLTGCWVIMVLVVAAAAGAGVLDSRRRNRARWTVPD